MPQRLIGFLLRERTFVLIATAILALAGLIAWQRLPIDAFPDATNVQVMVLTNASGLAPVDVEQQITFPIELAMQGLPGVREVRSLSKSGLSQVVVIFEDDVDTYFSRQIVFFQSLRHQAVIMNSLASADDLSVTFRGQNVDAESQLRIFRVRLHVKCFRCGRISMDHQRPVINFR